VCVSKWAFPFLRMKRNHTTKSVYPEKEETTKTINSTTILHSVNFLKNKSVQIFHTTFWGNLTHKIIGNGWFVRTSLNNKLRERRLFAWSSSTTSVTLLRLSSVGGLVWRVSGSGSGLALAWLSSKETFGLVAHPPIGVVCESYLFCS